MYPSIHVSKYPCIHDIQVSIYPSIQKKSVSKISKYPDIQKKWYPSIPSNSPGLYVDKYLFSIYSEIQMVPALQAC